MTVVEHKVARPPERALEPTPVTEADVLHRAAEIIEEWGWCQYALAKDEHGQAPDSGEELLNPRWTSFCAVGAMSRAMRELRGPYPSSVNCGSDIVEFNNAPGRTSAEVVARLRTLAARATPEGRAT